MKLWSVLGTSLAVVESTSLDMTQLSSPLEIMMVEQFEGFVNKWKELVRIFCWKKKGYTNMISQVVADFGLHYQAESIPSEPTMQNVKFNLDFLENNQDFVVSTTDSITNLGSKIWRFW